uniref:NADH-ubiquinone oxidoreductase chain 6 n=1 Tax=Propsilocerus taihuensis TaxID=2789523 RepID=A0A8K1NUL3_9DIPT|nr:NADH dehydrogenase subunit 6 [Propsilocerus taihuensis]UDE16201.1 NADH dehydrogenase subunit 6 [Propsilocerus taihuensis]
MFQIIISIMSMITSTIFMNMKHPLAMGLILMLQTLLICLISGYYNKTFWFSYILFLVFLGGMLVLFVYVTSLASNEMFQFSMKIFFISMIFIFCIYMMSLIWADKLILLNNIFNFEIDSFNHFTKNLIKENSLILSKLFNYPTNLITILVINYLFLTLIVSVKITKTFKGPLRPKIN